MPPSPLSYTGEVAVPYINKTFAPTTSNNKFSVPTLWIDTSAKEAYLLASLDGGTADWLKIGESGGSTEGILVDTTSGTGTNPVLPIISSGVAVITITGGQVAAGTTVNSVRTDSTAANSLTIEIQRSSAQASATVGANGISHFNSSHFSVDSDGFVSLLGGGTAVDSFTPDAGTSPVVPDGSGVVSIRGQATPNVSGIQVTGGTNELNLSLFSPYVGDFAFTSSTAAATRTLTISNSDNTAASDSGAANIISVGGSTQTGDPYTRWVVGTTFSYSCGIDTTDTTLSPSFKLTLANSANATPSSSTVLMKCSPEGLVQFPTANGTIANDGVLIGTAITINTENFLKIGDVETGTTATVDATTEASCGYGATSTAGDAYVNLNAFGVRGYLLVANRSTGNFTLESPASTPLMTLNPEAGPDMLPSFTWAAADNSTRYSRSGNGIQMEVENLSGAATTASANFSVLTQSGGGDAFIFFGHHSATFDIGVSHSSQRLEFWCADPNTDPNMQGLLAAQITSTGEFILTQNTVGITIGTGGPTITSGSGSPSSSQPKGSLYLRTDGSGTNDRAYIATDASGTWTAIVTVA